MALIEMETVSAKKNRLPDGLSDMAEAALLEHITSRSVELYADQPKGLQVEAVSSLVRRGHTFVRAGTGFGKTRISEMYFGLFDRKVVVLVLVPLDSLGDDQVREKKLVNITAINLNKMTLNRASIREIKKGKFSFVYLEFQAILALIVLDEAHMVYLWGLVASKHSKSLIIFARLEDQAIFRPAYGHIGTRLMATNDVPLLLLSATCRPEAVDAITSSLMLQPSELSMIDGELTRPEIRFVRIYMEATLSSCDDLLRVFAPHTTTPAAMAVPTIIYSGTRNRTFQVMKVVNEARDTKMHEYGPKDEFILRFHAVTGDQDKNQTISNFGAASVPVISATMALGLGQNLKRVRCVIHMGRGDPPAIVQMVGRCGRDGNVGLGLLFMEPTRKNGKNKIEDFEEGVRQDDDARMDALALTKCCLRIALALDNKIGYIPLSDSDPEVKAEAAREIQLGFAKCKCSNCLPAEAEALMKVFQQANQDNFDSMLDDPYSVVKDPGLVTMTRKRKTITTKATCGYPASVAQDLVQHLIHHHEAFYGAHLGPKAEFPASVFFGVDQAKAIVGSIDQIRSAEGHNTELMEALIGGQCFPGQINSLDQAISDWMNSEFYHLHLSQVASLDQFIEAEGIRVREKMAVELEHLQKQAIARRATEKAAKDAAKALAKAEIAARKATERLAAAHDKAQEKLLLAAEKAAEKARHADEKKAAKAQAARDKANGRAGFNGRAGAGAVNGGLISTSNGVNTDIPGGAGHMDSNENKRARVVEENKTNEIGKRKHWADRRAAADATRAADALAKAEGIRQQREGVMMKSMGAQVKRASRGWAHMAKVLRKSQVNADIEGIRASLAMGENQGSPMGQFSSAGSFSASPSVPESSSLGN
ncbi:uncharacterized protein PGTG_08028 [Puccinia graminis f. sp. tritici CRL 75-36-700-3]|uniref:DNA 3'-5' helicase n=1 Tax=Puccinia graminis f. sp. tritici (strain CRL 75-36-700-3 / race SCCL) TaxID=418459 RepID=E3KBX7_PUCGT|nr:uncharacterized protein PGTG_08028 [Puccinia graminis f. sp. tritici CRL 75-36-700-3]EFP81779.2 hypothetical protein PGTG_08028 [Puccinia graminis f. sp. tritici CRL 75-36-700-3]